MNAGKRSKVVVGLSAFVALLGAVSLQAQIFYEDFESYNISGDTNMGIPLESEGANETWYGGRFESFSGGTIDQDVAVRRIDIDGNGLENYARLEDDAGILFNISTVGYSSVTLSFDWRTHKIVQTADCFTAGYYIEEDLASPTIPDDLGFDLGSNRRRDFFTDDFGSSQSAATQWWDDEWTMLLCDKGSTYWHTFSTPLPVGKESIWIALWIDDGEGEYGKVDNILVTPEPNTFSLLALGGLTLLRRRRR